jgi:hypothetical protein
MAYCLVIALADNHQAASRTEQTRRFVRRAGNLIAYMPDAAHRWTAKELDSEVFGVVRVDDDPSPAVRQMIESRTADNPRGWIYVRLPDFAASLTNEQQRAFLGGILDLPDATLIDAAISPRPI